MPDPDKLTLADPSDLAAALAFALRYQGRKRVHNADEIMPETSPTGLLSAVGLRRHEAAGGGWRRGAWEGIRGVSEKLILPQDL